MILSLVHTKWFIPIFWMKTAFSLSFFPNRCHGCGVHPETSWGVWIHPLNGAEAESYPYARNWTPFSERYSMESGSVWNRLFIRCSSLPMKASAERIMITAWESWKELYMGWYSKVTAETMIVMFFAVLKKISVSVWVWIKWKPWGKGMNSFSK